MGLAFCCISLTGDEITSKSAGFSVDNDPRGRTASGGIEIQLFFAWANTTGGIKTNPSRILNKQVSAVLFNVFILIILSIAHNETPRGKPRGNPLG